jgi:hypothetical protein
MSGDNAQLRYVVLHHQGVADPHFDLMFEWRNDGPLTTLRYSHWPPIDPDRFERLPDHRRQYLDYEGPISGGRGFVRRVAFGFCTHEVDREDSARLKMDGGLSISIPRACFD